MRAVDAHEAQRGHEGRAVVAHEEAGHEPERGGGHVVTRTVGRSVMVFALPLPKLW